MKLMSRIYEGPGFWGICKLATSLKRAKVLIHGARGDAYGMCLLLSSERTIHPRILSTNLTEKDLAAGTLSGFRKGIKSVSANMTKDDTLFLVEADAIALLKEDLRALVKRLQKEITPRLFLVPINPFRDNETSVMERTLLELVKEYSFEQKRSSKPSVNIITPFRKGFLAKQDLGVVKRLLKMLDIEVNIFFPLDAEVKDLAMAGSAWFNISLYPEISYSTLNYLKNRYNQPYLMYPPIGLRATNKYISEIGEIVGRDYSDFISKNNEGSLLNWFRRIKKYKKYQKKIFIFGDITHTIGLTRSLIEDFDLGVVGSGTYVLDKKYEFCKQLKGISIPLLITNDNEKVIKMVREYKPDIILATLNEQRLLVKENIVFEYISLPERYPGSAPLYSAYCSFMGYEGMDNLIRKIIGLIIESEKEDYLSFLLFRKFNIEWTQPARNELEKLPAIMRKLVAECVEDFVVVNKKKKVTSEAFFVRY